MNKIITFCLYSIYSTSRITTKHRTNHCRNFSANSFSFKRSTWDDLRLNLCHCSHVYRSKFLLTFSPVVHFVIFFQLFSNRNLNKKCNFFLVIRLIKGMLIRLIYLDRNFHIFQEQDFI